MPPPTAQLRQPGLRTAAVAVAAAAVCLCAPAGAAADIVHLTSGGTVSVKAHRLDGESVVLSLRGGGEIVCPARLVSRVTPDEVPYPDETGEAAAALPGEGPVPIGPPTYGALITDAASRHGLDPRLLQAVIKVESNFEHRARSPKGAKGLMQLMPATARQYAVSDPYDPGRNIDAGARHLRSLLDRFDLRLALAAYNAGEGAVRRFGGMPPYRETRDYVRRILALVRSPAR